MPKKWKTFLYPELGSEAWASDLDTDKLFRTMG